MADVPEYLWVGGRHAKPLIIEKEAQACADRPPWSPGRWPPDEDLYSAWTLNTENCHGGGRDIM